MKKRSPVIILALIVSLDAQADFDFSGFATIAAGQASPDTAGETVDGFSEDFSFKDKSFIALQGASDVQDGLGATVQIVSRGSEDWNLNVTWAFVSYDASDNWRILAGRQRMPHYSYSDYIEVSYAYHWVTVPDEVYNAPFDSFDGISSIYTFEFDNSSLTTQVLVGEESNEAVVAADAGKLRSYADIMGGKLTYNYDWLTVKFAYFQFQETQTVDDAIEQQGDLTSMALGFEVNYEDWFVISEMTYVDLTDLKLYETGEAVGIGTVEPWMISVGKRFGDFVPHLTYGEFKELDFFDMDDVTPFYTAGLRWDFNKSAALKLEYSVGDTRRFGYGSSSQIALVTVF